MTLEQRVAERLKEAREYRGMTQSEFATAAGISQSWVCHFERGRRLPSVTVFVQLAKTLNVSLDYLAGLKAEYL